MTFLGVTTPDYGGKQLSNPVQGLSGAGAPPTNLPVNAIIGQTTYTRTTTQTVYMLTSKSPVTWTVLGDDTGSFSITPYVVGPAGIAGYQTIQAAATAAGAAGGGLVWIQGGSYTENLTIPANVSFTGADNGVTITGVHTPPTTSTAALTFDNIVFVSATDVLNSAAAGTTIINFNNCFFVITNGFVFNLLNWTGELLVDNCGEASTNDGVVNNTGGSQIKFINAELGAGTGQTMTLTGNGNVRFDTCNINCPVSIAGSGTLVTQNGSVFRGSMTIAGSKTATIVESAFITGAAAAITWSTSGAGYISLATINSSNNPAIAGAGAGVLTLGGINFISNAAIAGTLTVAYAASLDGATTIVGPTTITGTTNINATGSAVSTIGTGGTGATNIGNATGNTAVTGALTASTTLTATNGPITATSGNFVASAAGTGILLNSSQASGAAASPVIVNGRSGRATFTSVSIAQAADLTLTLTNSSITASTTEVMLSMSGATTGSALSIKSKTASAGSLAIVVTNGTGATTTTADIQIDFLVLNA